MVYSTDPHRAEGEDGHSYFVKGPDVEVAPNSRDAVWPPRSACPSPPVATCAYNGSLYAGSRKVEFREMRPLLKSTARLQNAADLYNMIVVDVWLANPDRNMGSLVGTQLGRGKLDEMMFIDFKKAVALRPNPLLQTSMLTPRQVWPTGELGTSLRQSKPLYAPVSILNAIERMTLARCEEILEPIRMALPEVTWAEDSAFALSKRSVAIRNLTEEYNEEGIANYRLLYLQPDPEDEERVCMGLPGATTGGQRSYMIQNSLVSAAWPPQSTLT